MSKKDKHNTVDSIDHRTTYICNRTFYIIYIYFGLARAHTSAYHKCVSIYVSLLVMAHSKWHESLFFSLSLNALTHIHKTITIYSIQLFHFCTPVMQPKYITSMQCWKLDTVSMAHTHTHFLVAHGSMQVKFNVFKFANRSTYWENGVCVCVCVLYWICLFNFPFLVRQPLILMVVVRINNAKTHFTERTTRLCVFCIWHKASQYGRVNETKRMGQHPEFFY